MTPEEKRKLQEVYDFIQKLKSSTTVPFEVEGALRERLNPVSFTTSTKTTASETQAVNEGGMASYDVAKPADAFVELTWNNTRIYIPYYT